MVTFPGSLCFPEIVRGRQYHGDPGNDEASKRNNAKNWKPAGRIPSCIMCEKTMAIPERRERRRTEIARALAVDPNFILLDEPFAGVDPIAVEDIQAVVARLKYRNIGILITDHNVNETLSICDRAYLLIEGKIFKHGTAEELADDEQVRRLYLGRNFELKRKDYLHEEASRPVI